MNKIAAKRYAYDLEWPNLVNIYSQFSEYDLYRLLHTSGDDIRNSISPYSNMTVEELERDLLSIGFDVNVPLLQAYKKDNLDRYYNVLLYERTMRQYFKKKH